jgi:tetratricopeptide (TPR) repeat protein
MIRGREAVHRHDWLAAFAKLSSADEHNELDAEQLELLGMAAWATGHYEQAMRARERAHAKYLVADKRQSAAMMAVMLAVEYVLVLDIAAAMGWHSAGARLLEGEPECLAHGFVEWYEAQAQVVLAGDLGSAIRHSREATEIGRRLNSLDMQMLGMSTEARALVKRGSPEEGTRLLDEAMAIAASGQLDSWTSALIYCNTLSTCQDLGDYRRATAWIEAAHRDQAGEGILPTSGHCRVHRAAVLRLCGSWDEAEQEARSGCEECHGGDLLHTGMAMYDIGEIRLRRGDLEGAEAAFRQAHTLGRTPQPGLALLRLSQGEVQAALVSIINALSDDVWDLLVRAELLAAQVEIYLAAEDLDGARVASTALGAIAEDFHTQALQASRFRAEGAIFLAQGEYAEALKLLRRACRLWQEVGVPYEVAKVRLLLTRAFAAVGDRDSAELEAAAARSTFERLGAAPDARRAAALLM